MLTTFLIVRLKLADWISLSDIANKIPQTKISQKLKDVQLEKQNMKDDG